MVVVICFWWGLFSWLYYDSFVMDYWEYICFYAEYFACVYLDSFCPSDGVIQYTGVDEDTHLYFAFWTAIPFIYPSYVRMRLGG